MSKYYSNNPTTNKTDFATACLAFAITFLEDNDNKHPLWERKEMIGKAYKHIKEMGKKQEKKIRDKRIDEYLKGCQKL